MTRTFFSWLAVAVAGFAAGCTKSVGPSPEILARLHFQGFERLDATTTLHGIWRLPETDQLRVAALDKLAGAWSLSLLPPRDGTDTNRAAWMRPLFDDVLRAESFLEIVGRTNDPPAWTLAIRLDDARAQVWQENWTKLAETARTNRHYAIARKTNSWLLVASDSAPSIRTPLWSEFTGERTPSERWTNFSTNAAWLEAYLDGPKLSRVLPWLANFATPAMKLAIQPSEKTLRTEAQLRFASAPKWLLEPWQFPTNTIRDPLISFTAARGFRSWLGQQQWFRKLGLASTPNQAVAWGQEDIPWHVQFAVPVDNATNEIGRLAANWVPQVSSNLTHLPLEPVYVATNLDLVSLKSFYIAPFIRRAPEPVTEFLNGGLIPIELSPHMPNTNPPPPELFAQVNRTNLVYYNWEVTQKRIGQMLAVLAQANILLTVPRITTNSPSYEWLRAIQDQLGNTVTEMTMVSQVEASLVRRSHCGLNGLELLALSTWIEGTNFPHLNLKIGIQPPLALPQVPAAAPPASNP